MGKKLGFLSTALQTLPVVLRALQLGFPTV